MGDDTDDVEPLLEQLLEDAFEKLAVLNVPPEMIKTRIEGALAAAGMPDITIPLPIIYLQRSLAVESDRGCALAGAAFVDSALEELLRAYLVDDAKIVHELFSPSGPLSSFSTRIDLSFLLGLVGPLARRDLHLIRRIRNEFAHDPSALSFSDETIASRCRELIHDVWQEDVAPRKRFVRALLGTLGVVHSRLARSTHCSPARDFDFDEPRMRERLAKFREELVRRPPRT